MKTPVVFVVGEALVLQQVQGVWGFLIEVWTVVGGMGCWIVLVWVAVTNWKKYLAVGKRCLPVGERASSVSLD